MNQLFMKYLEIILEQKTFADLKEAQQKLITKKYGKFWVKYYPELEICILVNKKPQAIHNYVLEFGVGDFLENFYFSKQITPGGLTHIGAKSAIHSFKDVTPVVSMMKDEFHPMEFIKITKKLGLKNVKERIKPKIYESLYKITTEDYDNLVELQEKEKEAKEDYLNALQKHNYEEIRMKIFKLENADKFMKDELDRLPELIDEINERLKEYRESLVIENTKKAKKATKAILNNIAEIEKDIKFYEEDIERQKLKKQKYEIELSPEKKEQRAADLKKYQIKMAEIKKAIGNIEKRYDLIEEEYRDAYNRLQIILKPIEVDIEGQKKIILLRANKDLISNIHDGIESFDFGDIYATEDVYNTLIEAIRFSSTNN